MNKAFLVGLVLQLIVLLVPPVMSIFEVVYLNAWEYVAVLCLSLVPVLISEIEKAVRKVAKKG
jgi:Ca2+-transporting ATPase